MTDKPIIIGAGIDSTSIHIAHLLAEKGLTANDVIIIDSSKHDSKEALKKAIEEASGKTVVIEDVMKMLEEPKEKVFQIHAQKRFDDMIPIKQSDVDKYHPFSKFMNNKRKKW